MHELKPTIGELQNPRYGAWQFYQSLKQRQGFKFQGRFSNYYAPELVVK